MDMNTVTSKDGTRLAYERLGDGPPLILVDGALCSRAFGPMPKLAKRFAKRFTVFMYDRRGRGGSSDNDRTFNRARELEDLEALLAAAGGRAHLLGLSSGAALALEAAASGLPVDRVFAYEPPYVAEISGKGEANHQQALERLIAEGRRADAVAYFMRDMVGAPGFAVVMMRLMPWIWLKLKAVAHTLPYDAAVMGDFTVPSERLRAIRAPTLVGAGGKTDDRLKHAARKVADAIPSAQHRELPGQTHNVSPDALVPAAEAFFTA